MRLLYVAKKLPFGHEEAFIIPELRAVMARGHDVRLAPLEAGGEVRHADAAAFLPITWAARLFSLQVLSAALLECLARPRAVLTALALLLRTRSPWLLLKNLAVLPKALWLAHHCRAEGIEHIHAHWCAVPGTLAMVAAGIAGIPFSLTCHRYDIAQNNLLADKAKRAAWLRAIDEAGAREIESVIGPDALPPRILHMGVELPVSVHEAAPDRRAGVRLLVAARLVEKKGHVHLLDAMPGLFRQGRSVTLDVYGEGPLEGALRNRVEVLGLQEAVIFHGTVSHDELLRRLTHRMWDAVVLPSVVAVDGDKEGIPVSLIEAMACGVPVIASDNGGIPELLRGGAGLMVAQRDSTAIAAAIRRLMDEPDLPRQLAQHGRDRVAREYAIDTIADALDRAFRTGRPPAA